MPWTDTTISTQRLTLRPFVDADKPAIVEIRTDADVYRYLGGPAGAGFVEEIRTATVGEQWGVFCVAEAGTDAAIGSLHFDRGRGVLEVSYELMPSHWGRGLAQEAVSAALAWAERELDDGDDQVIAVTQTANTASVALLGRLGFELERTFEEFDAEQGWFRRRLSA